MVMEYMVEYAQAWAAGFVLFVLIGAVAMLMTGAQITLRQKFMTWKMRRWPKRGMPVGRMVGYFFGTDEQQWQPGTIVEVDRKQRAVLVEERWKPLGLGTLPTIRRDWYSVDDLIWMPASIQYDPWAEELRRKAERAEK